MDRAMPDASLIAATEQPLNTLFMAARRCYFGGGYYDLLKEKRETTDGEKGRLIKHCIKAGHLSVLEHVNFTFHVTCSRATSAQFERHRIASYSEMSQRYCKFDKLEIVYEGPQDSVCHIETYARRMEHAYKMLLEEGIKPENARAILPMSTLTRFIVTMNCRSWLHFLEERLCSTAQKEIRMIAGEIHRILRINLPEVFEAAGPKCVRLGYCPEGKRGCGKKGARNEDDAQSEGNS